MLRLRFFGFLTTLIALVTMQPATCSAGVASHLGLRRPCDSLGQPLCLLPFPNDHFTRPDEDSETGLRVNFFQAEMPRAMSVKPIDPTEWNRNDGFSPGSELLVYVPGVDIVQTFGYLPITNIGRYTDASSPILLIDAQTGKRWPYWAEVDANISTAADGTPLSSQASATLASQHLLIIRPAVNFPEGHTILVALRNMRDSNGNLIAPDPNFVAYRDGTRPPLGDVEYDPHRARQIHSVVQQIAIDEAANGFEPSQVYLAWNFTIASKINLAGRILHMRDQSLAALVGNAPKFTVSSIAETIGQGATTFREVQGTISVPNYLDGPPEPLIDPLQAPSAVPVIGGQSAPGQSIPNERLLYGPDGMPMVNPVYPVSTIPFVCSIPASAVNPERTAVVTPAHPTIYGHGLLGSRLEATGGSTQRDRQNNYMPCAVNWYGFSENDIANDLETLLDPSNMPSVIDRALQGILGFIMLERALVTPASAGGFLSDPAFQLGGQPLYDNTQLVYDGNSQGGIMGGALCALSVDLHRCVLGVTAMNYSTLLNRSDDWEGPLINPGLIADPTNPTNHLPSFASFLYTSFPNKMDQQLVMALLQMLWDRAEADGYAQHMTTHPYPNTPEHQVLMQVAFGDFQVTNFAAEVEARTIGALAMENSIPSRINHAIFAWPATGGLEPLTSTNNTGSGFVYFDSGNLPPPLANVPPNPAGGDPHEDPRRDANGIVQKVDFWTMGQIVDVNNGGPYLDCFPFGASYPRVPSQPNLPSCP